MRSERRFTSAHDRDTEGRTVPRRPPLGRMPRAGATGVVLVRSGSYAPAVVRRFRQRLRTYWWLWAAIVVAVVILNEVFWEFATRASRRT